MWSDHHIHAHAHSDTLTQTHIDMLAHRDNTHSFHADSQTHPLPSVDHSTWSSVSSTSSKPSGQISCTLGPGLDPRLEP